MSTGAVCTTAVNGYAGPMRGDLDQMMSIADVTCGVQGMGDELRRHLQVACQAGGMAQNRAEAAYQVALMANSLQHPQMRAADLRGDRSRHGAGNHGRWLAAETQGR